MDERLKAKKEKLKKQEESFHYKSTEDIEKYITPFIVVSKEETPETERELKEQIASTIAQILDTSDNDILAELRSSHLGSFSLSYLIKETRDTLNQKMISQDAPWLEKLEEKMRTLEVFISSTDHEMDIEGTKKVMRKLLEQDNTDDSDKK